MKDRLVLITKDATCKCYLPIYEKGAKCAHRMPNLEELAAKGTVFDNFYTAAPSTAMSFISFSTQKYPYQTKHKTYAQVTQMEKDTIFDIMFNRGYECHIIWEEKWVEMAKNYSECYGEHSIFHLIHINQMVGAHSKSHEPIKCDEAKEIQTLRIIRDEINNTCKSVKEKLFLWIHLPHVLLGRNSYGSDEDMFDKVIGFLRENFDDDAIYISADHGNMNGTKGKIGYGFDVYQSAISIPLVTPRINNIEKCDTPISNIHLLDILEGRIPVDKFIYSDTAYYCQPHRKLAIIHNNYKYIYNKQTGIEELYDLNFDPTEECNLINRMIMDVDRHVLTPLDHVYYYPNWDLVEEEKEILRTEFSKIWRKEPLSMKILGKIKKYTVKYPGIYKIVSKFYHAFS